MLAGSVHNTIHTGQTWLNRYRNFLVVLLSLGATCACAALASIPRNKTSAQIFGADLCFCCLLAVTTAATEGQRAGARSRNLWVRV